MFLCMEFSLASNGPAILLLFSWPFLFLCDMARVFQSRVASWRSGSETFPLFLALEVDNDVIKGANVWPCSNPKPSPREGR